ncbi:MAG: 3'(2'),5'-bisphosphate nucleotidase CysQ [Burkholderiales bacterium]|nr:3'(2'),5'-bisphosphate nucleotidase CysQ [Burkholderiales bacterium]
MKLETTPAPLDLLASIEAIARAAGDVIMAVYGGGFEVRSKSDASPVTEADERAEALIVPALRALTPAWPVVAEEAAARGEAPAAAAHFWLVDPLDGTREFVTRNGEFTVNIALIEQGLPVLGVVFVPAQDRLYGGAVGQGAWCVEHGERRALRCRAAPADGATLATSRSHGDEQALAQWLQGRAVGARLAAGSSLKFGLVAAGLADLYPRLGRTMEWDTAAGHAVLRAAGGEVVDLQGRVLRYGKPGYENPHFVAHGLSGI